MFQTGRSIHTPPYRAIRPLYVRTLLAVLPLLSLVLAIWACGSRSFSAAPTPPITHLPGSKLRMVVEITGQYSDAPKVQVVVHVFDGPSVGDIVTLPASATLTCNGYDVKPASPTNDPQGKACPRQPIGGAYTLTYTDEQGIAANLVIPVLKGTFAILTPRPGATVRIPTNLLRVSYSTPLLPVGATVLIGDIQVTCGTADHYCGAVGNAYTYPPYATASVGPQEDAPTETPNLGPPTPTLPPGPQPATPTPYPVAPTPTLPDGEQYATPAPDGGPSSCAGAVINYKPNTSCTGVFDITGQFGVFEPGPGSVSIQVQVRFPSIKSDFAATSALYEGDTVSANITWTN